MNAVLIVVLTIWTLMLASVIIFGCYRVSLFIKKYSKDRKISKKRAKFRVIK